jgi:hypothetical protein
MRNPKPETRNPKPETDPKFKSARSETRPANQFGAFELRASGLFRISGFGFRI